MSNPSCPELIAEVARFIQSCADSADSRNDSGERFDSIARRLFSFQFETLTPYRQLCRSRGQGDERVASWDSIPLMPVEGFKAFDLSCLPSKDRTRVFRSSGTTRSNVSHHWHSDRSIALYELSVRMGMELRFPSLKRDASNGTRMIFLTPPPSEAPDSSLVWMLDTLRRALPASSAVFLGRCAGEGNERREWILDSAALPAAFESCVDSTGPVLVVGTAFNFVHLMDLTRTTRFANPLPEGSIVIETGGYKGRSRVLKRDELRSEISRIFSVPPRSIVGEYGMCELGSQAYERYPCLGEDRASSVSGEFVFPPWARARVFSPETGMEVADGETGLLGIVDLANVGSVCGIQTGDLATRAGDWFVLRGRVESVAPRGCSLMSAA